MWPIQGVAIYARERRERERARQGAGCRASGGGRGGGRGGGSGVPWYVWCHACGRYLSVREHALECECECVMHDN